MTDHPLTDEMCGEIQTRVGGLIHHCPKCYNDMRAAYDLGYTKGLEDASDIVTSIQRKDSIAKPVTLEELEAMRPQRQENN